MQDVLKKVIKDGFIKLKNNLLSSYILVFLFIAICSAGIALSFVSSLSFLSFIVIFFVALPFLFAVMVSLYGFRKNIDGLKWKNIFRYFSSYFKRPFKGAYRVIASICIFILVSIVCSIIFVNIGYNITISIYPHFPKIIEEMSALLSSTNIGLNGFMSKYAVEISTFFYLTLGPTFIVSVVPSLMFSLYNCYYSYFLINFPIANPVVSRLCYRSGATQARKFISKGFFAISWPLYLLLIGGYFLTAFLTYNAGLDYFIGNVIATMVAFGAAGLYLPIFFSLNESLFIENIDFYNPDKNDSAKIMLEQINKSINQQKRVVDELEQLKKQYEQNKQNNDQTDNSQEK